MKTITTLTTGILMASCVQKQAKLIYPETSKVDTIDTYFGVEIADPYRWLENDTSAATAVWVEAQNSVTNNFLARIPYRERLLDRLTEVANYERMSAPFKKHGKYYFYKNDGLQNQSVLYVQDSLESEPRVFLDPNKLSEDGTVALTGMSFSHNGKYIAYTISRSGSDWAEIYLIDLNTGERMKDHVKWAKFTSASWEGDGFYYSAYDAPETGKEFSSVNELHKIYYHKIGTVQSEDKLVYQNIAYPKRFYTANTTDDDKLLFLFESGEGRGNALYMKELTKTNAAFIPLATNMDYQYHPIEAIDGTLYIYTNYKAPKYRLMVTDIKKPTIENWKELIPESEAVLSAAEIIGGKLFLTYDKDASNHAYVYNLDGKQLHEINLPSLGSVTFSGNKNLEFNL